jgi:hypothetical protein
LADFRPFGCVDFAFQERFHLELWCFRKGFESAFFSRLSSLTFFCLGFVKPEFRFKGFGNFIEKKIYRMFGIRYLEFYLVVFDVFFFKWKNQFRWIICFIFISFQNLNMHVFSGQKIFVYEKWHTMKPLFIFKVFFLFLTQKTETFHLHL